MLTARMYKFLTSQLEEKEKEPRPSARTRDLRMLQREFQPHHFSTCPHSMPTCMFSHAHSLSSPHLISCRPVCGSLLPTVIHQLGQAGESRLGIVVQYSWPLSSDHQPIDVGHVLDLIKWPNTSGQLIEEHGKCKDIHLERYKDQSELLKKSIPYTVPLIRYNIKSSPHKTQLTMKSQYTVAGHLV